jgi:hypothetical protein
MVLVRNVFFSGLCPYSEHEEGIISMAASTDSNQLLTMGGDELLCLWKWSETALPNTGTNKATGCQTSRSMLDFGNLIR